jgi:hypothetical protein
MQQPLEIYMLSLRHEVECLSRTLKLTEQQLDNQRRELKSKQAILKLVKETMNEGLESEDPVQN